MKDTSRQTVHRTTLPPGLYVVATPIGNLGDITFRALQTLASCALVACEDTRVTGRLMHHFGLEAPLVAYHDHNAARQRPMLLERAAREPVALVSDAGTPLVSDPGYKLVREAVAAGIRIEALPGPSSVMAALCVAGLPTDRFFFAGFLPTSAEAAEKELRELARVPATLVVFESVKRVKDTLARMAAVLGGTREAAVLRELTKLHEEAVRGTLATLAAHYAAAPEPRGEAVIVVAPPVAETVDAATVEAALRDALARGTLKDAVREVSESLGAPRGEVYALALALKGKSHDHE